MRWSYQASISSAAEASWFWTSRLIFWRRKSPVERTETAATVSDVIRVTAKTKKTIRVGSLLKTRSKSGSMTSGRVGSPKDGACACLAPSGYSAKSPQILKNPRLPGRLSAHPGRAWSLPRHAKNRVVADRAGPFRGRGRAHPRAIVPLRFRQRVALAVTQIREIAESGEGPRVSAPPTAPFSADDRRAIVREALDTGRLGVVEATRLGRAVRDPQVREELCEAAWASADRIRGGSATVSRNIFIPLTNLCRNRCCYCTFAKQPDSPEAHTYSLEEVAEVVRGGVATGCIEALMCLGDKPEVAYRATATSSPQRGLRLDHRPARRGLPRRLRGRHAAAHQRGHPHRAKRWSGCGRGTPRWA